MILAIAFVPPHGTAMVDTLGAQLAWFVRREAKSGKPTVLPRALAKFALCNGMTREQRTFTLSRLCPESGRIPAENIDRSGMPDDVPRTWLLTLRDHTLSQVLPAQPDRRDRRRADRGPHRHLSRRHDQ